MSAKWFKLSATAVAASLFGFVVAPAQGHTQPLVDPATGASSGWIATWADAYDAAGWKVDLTFRGLVGNQFFFEKDATFKAPAGNGVDGLEILFQKVDPNAKELVINDEILTNQTGVAWNSFQWILASEHTGSTATSLGTPSFAFETNTHQTGTIGDFNISPFTTFNFSDGGAVLTFSGGTVANGQTWFAGANSNTGIAIVANSSVDSFVLKEVPAAIPLPAAAWTGMSTLLGLGLLAAAKNARKILA